MHRTFKQKETQNNSESTLPCSTTRRRERSRKKKEDGTKNVDSNSIDSITTTSTVISNQKNVSRSTENTIVENHTVPKNNNSVKPFSSFLVAASKSALLSRQKRKLGTA